MFTFVKHIFSRHECEFNPEDFLSIDKCQADVLLPRLKGFKDNQNSFPSYVKNQQEWQEMIDKMIYSLEYISKNVNGSKDLRCLARSKKALEGYELLSKHFMDLWV
ncbi:MAG: hypothetical protein BWY78_00715 [Alphaproteobacteria bacterium ADurb.Bin438]|nr:MAG: hypothetical protein BWY78_00715 [Alphaproteobacteria bacterium ADurb.Bin438]